jgi:hypothetical protein
MNEKFRGKFINFRTSRQESAALAELSRLTGLSKSETLRTLIREAAYLHGLPELGLIDTSEVKNAAN